MKLHLQHRHYCRIAAIIAAIEDPETRDFVAHHFGGMLGGTNPSYSYSRFVSAAQGKPWNGRDRVRP